MSSILPVSRAAPAASSRSPEPGQASQREVDTMFAAVYGNLKEPAGAPQGRSQPTNKAQQRGRALRETQFPLALMTRLAQQADHAAQRGRHEVWQARIHGVTPGRVRAARTQVLRARRAADLALKGCLHHAAAARRAPGNDALRDTAEAAQGPAIQALDDTASANVSYAEILVLDSQRNLAQAQSAGQRSVGLLKNVLDQAANQLEDEGGSPEQVASLRNLFKEPGMSQRLANRSTAMSVLERLAADIADSGRPGLARRVRGIKSVLEAAWSSFLAFDAARHRETSDSMRFSHIQDLSDRLDDLNLNDVLAYQTDVAVIQKEVAELSSNIDPLAAERSTPAAIAEARTVAAAQEAGFLPLDPHSGPTAESIARRHGVDDMHEATMELKELAQAYQAMAVGSDDPELFARAESLYQRLAEEGEAMRSGLEAAATADAAAAAAEPGNARLAAVAQQSAACLTDWRGAMGNAQSAMASLRVDAMEGQAYRALDSAEQAERQAKDALKLATDALGEAGVPDVALEAVQSLGELDADPATASGVMAQVHDALDALRLAPSERARLSALVSRAGDALTAAQRSSGHSLEAERLTSEAVSDHEAALDVYAQDTNPVALQSNLQTYFERTAGQYAAVQREAAAARTAQGAAGAAAQAARAVGRAERGAEVSDMETAAPPPPPTGMAPPPPPLGPQEAEPLVEAGTRAGGASRAAIQAAVRTHGGADSAAAQAAADAALTTHSTALAERILAHPRVRSVFRVGGEVLTAAAVAAMVAQLALAIRTDVKNGDRTGKATRRAMAELVGGLGGAEIGAAGGAAAGASVGAAVGSVVPVLGTAAGALVGSAVGGFVGGLLGFGAGAYAGGQIEDDVQSLIDGWGGGQQPPAARGALGDLAGDPLANARRLIQAGSSDDDRVNAPELRRALTTSGYTLDADNDVLSRCIDAYSRAGDGALGTDELAAMLRDASLTADSDGAIEVDAYHYSINLSVGDASHSAAAGHIASRWIHLDHTRHGGEGDRRLNAAELVDSLEASGYRLAKGVSEKDIGRVLTAYDRFGHGAVNHQDLKNALVDGALVIDIDGSVNINGSRMLGQAIGQAANMALRIVQAGGQQPQAYVDASALHDNLQAAGYSPVLSEADCATLIGEVEAPEQPGRVNQAGLQQAIERGLLVFYDDGTVGLPARPGA